MRKEVHCIPSSDIYFNTWCEEMCWLDKDTLVVAAHNNTDEVDKFPQLTLIYDCRKKIDPVVSYKTKPIKQRAHSKGITCISAMDCKNGENRWLTGGLDKNIFMWSAEKGINNINVKSIPSKHSSKINALFHLKNTELIISGGQDCRLVGWSLESQSVVFGNEKERLLGPVRDIFPIYNQPQSILLV